MIVFDLRNGTAYHVLREVVATSEPFRAEVAAITGQLVIVHHAHVMLQRHLALTPENFIFLDSIL